MCDLTFMVLLSLKIDRIGNDKGVLDRVRDRMETVNHITDLFIDSYIVNS